MGGSKRQNKASFPTHDQSLSWLGMCVACESLSVSGCSGGSGHVREDLNVRQLI